MTTPSLRLPFALVLVLGLLAGTGGETALAQHPTAVTSIVNSEQDTTLEVNHNSSLLMPGNRVFDGTENDSIPAEGAGTRLMWYPAKAAFRAGWVGAMPSKTDVWDADSIGRQSVAFGVDTRASGRAAAALGNRTTASDFAATAMGSNTTASGSQATALGTSTTASDNFATAMGASTTASGLGSMAVGRSTTASGSRATAMGESTTAATDVSLSIGQCNSANNGSSGDGTLFVAGNGPFSSGTCNSRSDALVLKKDGDLAVGPSDPSVRLHVTKDKSNKGVNDNPDGNIVLFENTDAGDKPDVMGLQAGPSDPGNGVAYLTFYDRFGTTVGQIEGNGSGGINIEGDGADVAEELPVADGAERPEAADLVGVRGGAVSLQTGGADRVMIASTAPIMTGNTTLSTDADDARRVAVAFIGQVPAKVRGPAQVGDLIVPSGKNDGTARAVAPAEYRHSTHGPIAGQAWSDKSTDGIGEVTVAVGLGSGQLIANQLREERRRNDRQDDRIDRLEKQLTALKAERTSTLAGLGGSAGLLLFGFLLGGLLGAGLLWRRQDA